MNNMQMLIVLLSLTASTQLPSRCTAQTSSRTIKFVNSLDEAIELWFRPESSSKYIKPTLGLGPKVTKSIPLSDRYPGRRYIVMRDEANRDTHIGWVDLEAIASSRSPVVLIDGIVVTEQRTQQYTVAVPVYESVIGPDGRPRTVKKYRSETRERTVNVYLRVPRLRVAEDGEWKDISAAPTLE
jgi:hypothetical protein